MVVGGETKIGSGTNFVDMRRGCTGSLEEEGAGAGVTSAPAFVEEAGASCSWIARLRLFAQQGRIGMG